MHWVTCVLYYLCFFIVIVSDTFGFVLFFFNITQGMFYQFVRSLHGSATVKHLKQLNTLSRKLVRSNCRKVFLLNCRKWRVTPKFLDFNFRHVIKELNCRSDKCTGLVDNFKSNMLNVCIDEVNAELINLNHRVKLRIDYLKSKVPEIMLIDFINTLTERNFSLKNSLELKLRKKFHSLRSIASQKYRQEFAPFMAKKETWIENISNKELPECVSRVLCLGPMFSVPYFNIGGNNPRFKAIPLDRIITIIETRIRHEFPPIMSKIRNNVVQVIKNYYA